MQRIVPLIFLTLETSIAQGVEAPERIDPVVHSVKRKELPLWEAERAYAVEQDGIKGELYMRYA